MHSRSKIQFVGGGFGNGKTAAECIKALEIGRAYPGSNILIARSTFPRLRDTIMKEFKKWCPADWIKSFPQSENSSKTCTLINGTEINFRYVQQKGKGDETGDTKSNLLSATYDAIFVDQIEDPEIMHKDFLDLLGRLRGNTKLDPTYRSDLLGDAPMPLTGPRWMSITSNPTRNWVYKKLIKPYHDYKEGRPNEDLLCQRNEEGSVVLVDGRPVPIIEVFEGSTYENKDNLGADFIQTLESAYTGQMRQRFLLGEWAAYEGLVYPMYDPSVNLVSHKKMSDWFYYWLERGQTLTIVEAYDHGIAVPACYLFGFVDPFGNVCVLDGFYDVGVSVEQMTDKIKAIRSLYLGNMTYQDAILADPAIFRRTTGGINVVGVTVADLFYNDGFGVNMVRASNDIIHGIAKVQSYLNAHRYHQNPFTGDSPAPYLYFSDTLTFLDDEMGDYIWKHDTYGDMTDKPIDRRDHAMDTLKYLLTYRPRVADIKIASIRKIPPYLAGWHEGLDTHNDKGHRYGRN